MNYRRILFITQLSGDSGPALALTRRVAPHAEQLSVLARVPLFQLAWLSEEAPLELRQAAAARVQGLRDAATGAAPRVDVQLRPTLTTDALAELARALKIDLLVAGALSRPGLHVLAAVRKRCVLPVLWPAGARVSDGAIRRIVCPAPGTRAPRALAQFLRDHADPLLHAVVGLAEVPPRERRSSILEVAGIPAAVELLRSTDVGSLLSAAQGTNGPIDLLILPRFPGALTRATTWPAPVLVLPPSARGGQPRRPIDAPDVVDDAGVLRLRIDYAGGVGRREPIPDQAVALVTGGRRVALVTTDGGRAELPPGLVAETFGVYRLEKRQEQDPVAAVERDVAVIRPGTRPVLLFPAELPDEDLARLANLANDSLANAPELLAVRMQATRSCQSLRARLAAAGLTTRLADASTVLDEGDALDVAEALDTVRLARAAARMRGAGFPVAGVVHAAPDPPHTIGFAALRAHELSGIRPTLVAVARAATGSMAARLDATTGAPSLPGNRVEIEMDNASARRWLLEAIGGSRERVHLQVYMAADDDVGAQVEAALAAAGARGVKVRVLVDSLHGLHGSLGLHNPLLDRLGTRPGVELRVSRPITGVPTLEDLKQRDHRKVALIDGTVALVGGRNLSHEYYTDFDEVSLSPASPWREVPWLDAGARLCGPAVAVLERHFLDAWQEAGGDPFGVSAQAEVGSTSARVVVHRGLRDAATLEAYLAIIDAAQSHIYVVNGFPLILEIQHALLRAIRRGVRVCALFGHLTPRHEGGAFRGPWARARTAATEYVHSRVDALVAAGGEGFQLVVPQQPGWAAGIGPIYPHVHAKVVSADGRVCTVGSANLDITAGYWESELMLLVEDETVTRALEARIEQLIAVSERVNRDDPGWQRLARQRDWMRHWPGVLSI